jgi:DNA-binding MarR family transcriptional regulator
MTEPYSTEMGRTVEAMAGALVEVWLGSTRPGLPAAQLRALQAVERRPGLTIADLAAELGTIASWASRLCDRLEADGYLERRPSDHGRRHLELRLRTDGYQILDALRHQRGAAIAHVLVAMTGPERAALLRGLHGFARARQAERPAADSARTA